MGRQRRTSLSSAVALAALLACAGLVEGAPPGYTTRFALEQCTFEAGGRNAHFSLQPGYRLFLAGSDEQPEGRLRIGRFSSGAIAARGRAAASRR
jgi:hypothetical protein